MEQSTNSIGSSCPSLSLFLLVCLSDWRARAPRHRNNASPQRGFTFYRLYVCTISITNNNNKMWAGREGGGGEEANDGVGHRGQSLKFKKARWMNERKNEEVETECSARELVHTEVAVSIPYCPPSPSRNCSRPYRLTHPSLYAAVWAAAAAGNGQRSVVRAEVRCRSGNSR